MLSIDFRNAVQDPTANNFTCMLFRLMLKADDTHFRKLGAVFPTEARMVEFYKENCCYRDKNRTEVDWELLEIRAKSCPPGYLTEEEKKRYTCYDCSAKDECEFAYDEYNTDGDCLADK